VVGWDKDEESFFDYARVKTVRVQTFGSAEDEDAQVGDQTLTFEDKRGWQVMDLVDAAVGGELSGGRLRVTVTEVYPGRDYPSLAVSEVQVQLSETDVQPQATKMKTPPESEASGHDAAQMVDGDGKTFWASLGAGTQSFEVHAEGFGVSSIGFLTGPTTFARPKTLEYTANDIATRVVLEDQAQVQWFPLPAVVGYTGSAWGSVTVTVIDTYPGQSDSGTAISDVYLRATNYDGL
jgi:hypothetical protein